MTYTTLEIESRNGIGIVWMNRPDVRNAMNEVMIGELAHAFAALDAEAGIRAVVLAGRGSAFCAGGDLNWMKKTGTYSFEQNFADAARLAEMLARLAHMRKPTIARVHGPAFAGGMGLVAACDIAVAVHGVQFCLSEVKIGLTPATISPYVIAAMGERLAHRYFLTAERFDASEAYRIGFVQEICPEEELDATINGLLGHLVAGGPAALAATKDLIRAVAHRPVSDDLMKDTATRIAAIRATAEGQEGIRSFLEKRKPAWVEPPKGKSLNAKARGLNAEAQRKAKARTQRKSR
jgi:methylglutaconyl-CoA hydratase